MVINLTIKWYTVLWWPVCDIEIGFMSAETPWCSYSKRAHYERKSNVTSIVKSCRSKSLPRSTRGTDWEIMCNTWHEVPILEELSQSVIRCQVGTSTILKILANSGDFVFGLTECTVSNEVMSLSTRVLCLPLRPRRKQKNKWNQRNDLFALRRWNHEAHGVQYRHRTKKNGKKGDPAQPISLWFFGDDDTQPNG